LAGIAQDIAPIPASGCTRRLGKVLLPAGQIENIWSQGKLFTVSDTGLL